MIGASWRPIVIVHLAQDQDVGQFVEGIGEDANGLQHTIGIVALGLAS